MAKGRKTGGRVKGSKNKKKKLIIEPINPTALEKIEQGLLVLSAKSDIRTPKLVMLDAMLEYENLGRALLAKAQKMTRTRANLSTIEDIAKAGHRYISAAVDVAHKLAPFVHARLLAVESRGSMTEDEAPFVIRVPSVASDSAAWQAAVLAEAAELEASQPAIPARPEVFPPIEEIIPPSAAFAPPEAPSPPAPAVLQADPKTSRVTAMAPGPTTIRPSGADEWLAAVYAERGKILSLTRSR